MSSEFLIRKILIWVAGISGGSLAYRLPTVFHFRRLIWRSSAVQPISLTLPSRAHMPSAPVITDSNFAFLRQEFPAIAETASQMEKLAFSDARASCFYARRTI